MSVTLASDAFGRTVAAGSWGSADMGGVWTLVNGSAQFRVDGSKGCCDMQATYDRQAYLNDVSSTNAHIRVALQSSSAYSGSYQTFNVIGRKTATGVYQARVRIESGLLRLYILRDETTLASSTTITHTYVAGDVIMLDLSVTGTSPTTVSAKMWRASGSATDTEPGSYTQTATDSTAGYQVAGTVGFKFAMSAGTAPGVMAVDNYLVEDPTSTVLGTPAVTISSTNPSTVGGSNGTITATWPAIPSAHHYESCLVSGTVTSGFTADDTAATSPKTYTGLAAGTYTVAVRAKAS